MKNKFTIGAIAGMSSMVLAIPLLAQISSAQQVSSATTSQAQVSQADPDTDVADTQFDPHQGGHVGANGTKEELLTGDNASKVTAAALVAVPGGTVDRVETDAEGDAYEAHMTKADGSHVTVKFDSAFNVTKIESGPGGPKGQ